MLDPWDELETLQKGRWISFMCARELETIRDTCIREHGKAHPVECPECWTRLVNRVRDRYLNSSIKEWFSGRRVFLQELDDLFNKAHKHEVDIPTIGKRIADEKKEWFKDKVRNVDLQTATRSPTEAQALQNILDRQDIPSDQLMAELTRALNLDTKLYKNMFYTFSNQVKSAKDVRARAQAWIDALFPPEHDPANAAKSQRYIDMIKEGKSLAKVYTVMIHDRMAGLKENAEHKNQLKNKLEELRRAKAAHDLAKAKRDQARKEKAQAAMEAGHSYQLSPCDVCKKTVGKNNFITCTLCSLLVDLYQVIKEPTMFCSDKCHDKGYDAHLEATHECVSGMDCISLTTGADDEMDMDEPTLVLCRVCVEEWGRAPFFCSARCFDANSLKHRKLEHIPDQERELPEEGQVVEFDPGDETLYSVQKGEGRIIRLKEAMDAWQKKTGAKIR